MKRVDDTTYVQTATVPTGANGPGLTFFCDAGCSPNPGVSVPMVVLNGRFLDVPARAGRTNHRALYDAIDFALHHAIALQAREVTVNLSQPLIWGQVTDIEGVQKLREHRDATVALAGRVPEVTWRLVRPPFPLGREAVRTTKGMRARLNRLYRDGQLKASWPTLSIAVR